MKLYTEKQMKEAIKMAQKCDYDCGGVYFENDVDDVFEELTPIELPSDEQIEEMGKDVIVYNDTKRGWFVEGLRFMRDKIGGNK